MESNFHLCAMLPGLSLAMKGGDALLTPPSTPRPSDAEFFRFRTAVAKARVGNFAKSRLREFVQISMFSYVP